MSTPVKGLKDIHAKLSNERKIGGVIETQFIRLRSGEEYKNAVITNVDVMGSSFYSLSFVNDEGQHMIVNVAEIGMISVPVHKKIVECQNQTYKQIKIEEKLTYLKRLYEVNEGSTNPLFVEEAKMVIQDIGIENVKPVLDVSFLSKPQKLYSIA
ncbi:hypothetical protein LC040_07285 [Bacillus tianshenii]|nr:hypothetical protein LC040_07285 [Bacillus tianshenii]